MTAARIVFEGRIGRYVADDLVRYVVVLHDVGSPPAR